MTRLEILLYAEETAERKWMRAIRDYSFISENAGLFRPETLETISETERNLRLDLNELRRMISEESPDEYGRCF